jgi:hypothetical protein
MNSQALALLNAHRAGERPAHAGCFVTRPSDDPCLNATRRRPSRANRDSPSTGSAQRRKSTNKRSKSSHQGVRRLTPDVVGSIRSGSFSNWGFPVAELTIAFSVSTSVDDERNAIAARQSGGR